MQSRLRCGGPRCWRPSIISHRVGWQLCKQLMQCRVLGAGCGIGQEFRKTLRPVSKGLRCRVLKHTW